MATVIVRILVLAMFAAVGAQRLVGQQVDPKVVAKLVTEGKVKFAPKSKITIWLDENQSYSISPVIADNPADTYRTEAEFEAMFGGQQGPPRPPLPPRPPPPINHGGPRPPAPVPPGPHNSRPPRPQPRPPKPMAETTIDGIADNLLYRLAAQRVIVGRLETEGISQRNWKLAKGTYTMVLMLLDGKPVVTLVNSRGEFVVTFDNIFFVNAQ